MSLIPNKQFDIASKRWTCIQESSDTGPADEASAPMEDVGREADAAISGHSRQPSRRFGYVSVVHAGKLVSLWIQFIGGTKDVVCMVCCYDGILIFSSPFNW